MPCPDPDCHTMLQPVVPSSSFAERAYRQAKREGLPIPAHGPAVAGCLALIAHAQLCHPDVDLRSYMEAYMRS